MHALRCQPGLLCDATAHLCVPSWISSTSDPLGLRTAQSLAPPDLFDGLAFSGNKGARWTSSTLRGTTFAFGPCPSKASPGDRPPRGGGVP